MWDPAGERHLEQTVADGLDGVVHVEWGEGQ